MTVWRGQSGPRYRIKTVRLQVSFNDGAIWRLLPLTREGRRLDRVDQ